MAQRIQSATAVRKRIINDARGYLRLIEILAYIIYTSICAINKSSSLSLFGALCLSSIVARMSAFRGCVAVCFGLFTGGSLVVRMLKTRRKQRLFRLSDFSREFLLCTFQYNRVSFLTRSNNIPHAKRARARASRSVRLRNCLTSRSVSFVVYPDVVACSGRVRERTDGRESERASILLGQVSTDWFKNRSRWYGIRRSTRPSIPPGSDGPGSLSPVLSTSPSLSLFLSLLSFARHRAAIEFPSIKPNGPVSSTDVSAAVPSKPAWEAARWTLAAIASRCCVHRRRKGVPIDDGDIDLSAGSPGEPSGKGLPNRRGKGGDGRGAPQRDRTNSRAPTKHTCLARGERSSGPPWRARGERGSAE